MDFIPETSFAGSKRGYYFTKGVKGLGYYRDGIPPLVEPSAKKEEGQKKEKKEKKENKEKKEKKKKDKKEKRERKWEKKEKKEKKKLERKMEKKIERERKKRVRESDSHSSDSGSEREVIVGDGRAADRKRVRSDSSSSSHE